MAAVTLRSARPAARAASLASPSIFRHVVCLSGLSPEGGVAESHAGLVARATGAKLTLYHSSDTGLGYAPGSTQPLNRIKTAAERLARATLEGEATATGVPRGLREVVVERGSPTAASMAAAVRRLGADIVVMAPQSRGLLSRALGVSLTETTVDRLGGAIPVLCARGAARPYRRILVATDFSAGSRRSFRLSARLAAVFGATVTVLHAVADPDAVDGALAVLRRFIPRELNDRAPRLAVVVGEPCAAILSEIKSMDADLVVLSTRGRDSVRDAVLGTHAQRVIRYAPCPVLVS